jgi:hypothetical protein
MVAATGTAVAQVEVLKNAVAEAVPVTVQADICFVVGHLKYREYVCVPSASHLQHPVNAYSSVGCGKTGVVIP